MNIIGKWRDKATRYVDVRLQLIKLGVIERASNVLGSMMLGFILLFLAFSMLIFMGMGLMKAMSIWLDSEVAGSFATAGIFLVLILLFVGLRTKIKNIFAGLFVGIITASDEEEDDEDGEENKADEDDEND
jgi:uncharacterized membrane protein YqjE